jgi:uncharacterized protein (TIGR02391 family)
LAALWELIPDAQALLDLEPEELGLVLLQVLNSRPGTHHGGNFASELEQQAQPYGAQTKAAQRAVMEAWAWLVGQGLLAMDPNANNSDVVFVTRRGRRITSAAAATDYRKASFLPLQLLHPALAAEVRPTFLRGDYETAVFQAFKKVEVAVREASGFAATDFGTDLMRKAFKKEDGPLVSKGTPAAEQEALAHLAAGAIGSYKNPMSHRTVTISDPTDAVEMIMLASHLLRIVEARRK